MDIEQFAESVNFEDLALHDTKRVRLGEYDYMASSIHLQATRKEYAEEYDKFTMNLDMGPKVRTGFHELVHFFQYHTTPFGMYLSLLADFQVLQLKSLVCCAKEVMEIGYPLLPRICRYLRPVNRYWKVWYHLKYWYLAELVRLYFIGDMANFGYYYNQSIFSKDLPSQWFSELEKELCNVLNITCNDRILKGGESDAANFAFELALRTMSDSDASNIFENQARMAQYWWEMGYIENPFTKVPNVSTENKYSGLITEYCEFANAKDFPQFHETFYAICELALFAPVLPFQASSHKISLRDLTPIVRVRDLMRTAQSIEPIKDMDDHRRFLDELSERSNYPPLQQLLNDSIIFGQRHNKCSYDSLLFYTSQLMRMDEFSIIYNLGRWHPMSKYQYGDARDFSSFFIPPIVRFKDQTLFFKPGEIIQPIVERYFMFYYLKELLIGFRSRNWHTKGVPVHAPFHRGEEDLKLQNYICGKAVKATLGDSVPPAIVVYNR